MFLVTAFPIQGIPIAPRQAAFPMAVPYSPPYAARFSNGPVWVEYLAPQLGISSVNNFAYGGATTGTFNTLTFPTPLGSLPLAQMYNLPGLQTQVSTFVQTTPVADPDALYVVWAGANDYLGAPDPNPLTSVNNLATAIQSLAGVGARNFLIPNLPDLGNLPGTSSEPAAGALSLLSSTHNSLLASTLSVLGQTYGSSVNLIPLDINSLVSAAIAKPAAFGLTNGTDSCLSISPPSLCSNPDEYLFWDDLHPTTAAHQRIASYAFTTLQASAVPEPPATLGLVAFGAFLGGASLLKRQQRRRVRVSELVAAAPVSKRQAS